MIRVAVGAFNRRNCHCAASHGVLLLQQSLFTDTPYPNASCPADRVSRIGSGVTVQAYRSQR